MTEPEQPPLPRKRPKIRGTVTGRPCARCGTGRTRAPHARLCPNCRRLALRDRPPTSPTGAKKKPAKTGGSGTSRHPEAS
ncbi:MAG: hypothetical protein ABGY75_04540 [Gemmataceae bacterium]